MKSTSEEQGNNASEGVRQELSRESMNQSNNQGVQGPPDPLEQAQTQESAQTQQTQAAVHPQSSRPALIRLVIMAVLYLGWMGYLAYLVTTLPTTRDGRPLILSRAQLMVSEVDVVAQVNNLNGEVTVTEVLYPKKNAPLEPGQKIKVLNLNECQPLLRVKPEGDPPIDWTGPGLYILPLRRFNGGYAVVHTPSSPGYPRVGPPRMYPANEQARSQYHAVPKGE